MSRGKSETSFTPKFFWKYEGSTREYEGVQWDYDGSTGVSLFPPWYYVHCNAQSLDLALKDLTRESPSISSALNITNDIINFMKKSPKR